MCFYWNCPQILSCESPAAFKVRSWLDRDGSEQRLKSGSLEYTRSEPCKVYRAGVDTGLFGLV